MVPFARERSDEFQRALARFTLRDISILNVFAMLSLLHFLCLTPKCVYF
jgi:hypothetical protein